MKFHIVFAAGVALALACPLSAQAQGIPDGIAHGADVGNQTAGPIGAVVGGAVGVLLVATEKFQFAALSAASKAFWE